MNNLIMENFIWLDSCKLFGKKQCCNEVWSVIDIPFYALFCRAGAGEQE